MKRAVATGPPRHRVTRLVVGGALFALTAWLVQSDVLWRLDRGVYDFSLQFWFDRPPDDVVIVAVDKKSLQQLGSWPWNRRIHAEIIKKLTKAGARVIALDFIFAEDDILDPGADAALAAAIEASQRVVLPVIMEAPRLEGQPIEVLPLPALSAVAAELGHVVLDYDKDGLARHAFLRAGLGDPHWRTLAAAMLHVSDPKRWAELPGERIAQPRDQSKWVWAQDNRILIPYVGRPGSIKTAPYVDVLNERMPLEIFQDKFVLVGATAFGLGDIVATPLQETKESMPGVEFNANVLDALMRGRFIVRVPEPLRLKLSLLPEPLRLTLSLVPVLIAMWLYPRLPPIATLLCWLALFAGTIAFCLGALWLARWWFAPAPALAAILVSYPAWSWIRLEVATRYLRQELDRLQAEQAALPKPRAPALGPSMRFFRALLPIRGWSVLDTNRRAVRAWGEAIRDPPPILEPGTWRHRGRHLWARFYQDRQEWLLGAIWDSDQPPNAAQARFLDAIAESYAQPPAEHAVSNVELVQIRIDQLREASEGLRVVRQMIREGMSQMADGVLIVNVFGQVLLANQQAARYLTGNTATTLENQSILDFVEEVAVEDGPEWSAAFEQIVIEQTPIRLNARHRDGRYLLVQMSPVRGEIARLAGVIINLSDITALKESERKRAEVISFLSHDLRSPLVSVMATVELAKEDPSPEAFAKVLARIERYTKKTLALAEQFLDLSRAESGETTELKEVDLTPIVLNAIEQVWSQSRKKHIQLTQSFDVETALVRGEAGLLERALVNLLNNAIKYSRDNSTVHITLSEADGQYRCSVEDSGYGIAADDIPKLFNRFQRLSSATLSGEQGAGLGLAFVKAVAERHNGDITVESEEGVGSKFILHLPAW